MLRTVAVVLQEPTAFFELGVLCEVFGFDRSDDGVPPFDFRVCAARPGVPMATTSGPPVIPPLGLDAALDADLVCVPATDVTEPDEAVLALLRSAVDRGARVLSVCSGAFTLGAAGLLDGRRCTTHWKHADRLAEQFPRALVDPGVLYCDDGPVVTSAGTAAGIDACLHLVRTEHGTQVANAIARRMVVPPHRDGGQRQFVQAPVPSTSADSLEPLLSWMLEHLEVEHTVPDLAARAHLSERTFARRFAAEVGTTPHKWLVSQRVLRARALLEQTELDVEQVARRSGFGTAALLRHHFRRDVGLSPGDYRRRFCGAA